MRECTEEQVYYKTFRVKNRKKRRKAKRFFAFTLIFAIVVGTIVHVNGAVFNLVSSICEDYTRSAALTAIHNSVMTSLTDKIAYSDLVKVEKNKDGDIAFMSADSLKINTISRTVAVSVEKELKEKLKDGIPVPIFAFTGIKLASGYGPSINYSAITVASVNCGFDGNFEQMGINQTLHSLYVVVNCRVDIEFLYKKRTFDCASEILISESVLIGKVPEVYLNGTLFK